MKNEICGFSGHKIYPGHGKRVVRIDGRVHQFLSSKNEAQSVLKRNPREIRWTELYRRKHKKGKSAEEGAKRRSHRRTVANMRAVVGASLTEIMAKRNQKPEVRRAQRDEAVRAAKERIKAARAVKVAQKTQVIKQQQKRAKQDKAAKRQTKSAPKVGVRR